MALRFGLLKKACLVLKNWERFLSLLRLLQKSRKPLPGIPGVSSPCQVVADTSRRSISIDNVVSKQSIGPHDVVGEKLLFSNFSSF